MLVGLLRLQSKGSQLFRLGGRNECLEWLSIGVLLLSFVALLLAIKSGPLEIDIGSLRDRSSK
jgi:hypothetical protein